MSRIALINIDTQQSFHHRNYWQEDEIPAFQQAMLGLIEGCQARNIPVVDIFTWMKTVLSLWKAAMSNRWPFYVISRMWFPETRP